MQVFPGRGANVLLRLVAAGALLVVASLAQTTIARGDGARGAQTRSPDGASPLSGAVGSGQSSSPVDGQSSSPVEEEGERVFAQLGCQTCHDQAVAGPAPGRGPSLAGVAGSRVELAGGTAVTADDDYLRESILRPGAKVAKGYPPLMPAYDGLVTEDQLRQLIAYIKSLKPPRQGE